MNSKALFDAPEIQTQFLFECKFKKEFDHNKENLLIITKKSSDNFSYLFGFVFEIIDLIKDHFNVIIIANEKNISNQPNVYSFNLSYYNKINDKKFKRKEELKENIEYNQQILVEEFEKCFDFTVDKVIFAEDTWHMLPRTNYVPKKIDKYLAERQNEFHDYVGNDSERLALIRNEIEKVNKNFYSRISILAFSMFKINIMQNLVSWFNEKKKIKMLYTFNIDPATWLHFFDYNNITNTKFYFENDKRGTRNFVKFPISHLQHLIYEPIRVGEYDSTKKEHDFFFMGTILQEKGDRIKLWETFFKNLRLPNSHLYIPNRANGIFKDKKSENSVYAQKNIKKANDIFEDVLKEMKENPMWVGHILPIEVRKTISTYKYGFVAKCTSYEDSLNYRPVNYVFLNILPIFDKYYDPDFIQIPKHIQDKLTVTDSISLEEKIKYFNNHNEERLLLLKQLYDHFKIEDFLKNWKEIIKSYFI